MNDGPPDDGLNAWRRQELVWTLRWLAADPRATVSAVEGVCVGDEIALDVEHWYEIAQEWGLIDEPLALLVGSIDRAFDEMSSADDPELWTDDAIQASELWAAQRERARAALVAMGEARADDELSRPRQGGPVYVRGRPSTS